jgi:hypothetical protein
LRGSVKWNKKLITHRILKWPKEYFNLNYLLALGLVTITSSLVWKFLTWIMAHDDLLPWSFHYYFSASYFEIVTMTTKALWRYYSKIHSSAFALIWQKLRIACLCCTYHLISNNYYYFWWTPFIYVVHNVHFPWASRSN